MDKPDASLNTAVTSSPKPSRRFIQQAFGYLLAAACLVWVIYDIRPGELVQSLTNIQWRWVALAIFFDIASYVCQGWRWQLLLRPVGDIRVLHTTHAIYVGLFTNEVLPMRFGELVRSYLVSRWIPTRFSSVIPSLIVERFFDGVWLAVLIGVTAMFVPLPKELLKAGDTLGAIVLAATALFLYVVYRKRDEATERPAKGAGGWKPFRLLKSFLAGLEKGIRAIGFSKPFYAAFAVSLIFLLGQILAFWLIMLAYGLWFSFWIGTVVLLIVHLGTAIPNAPANVGTYQFFVVVGLTLFGVDKTLAAGFSFVVFFLLTVPLWIIGSFALSRTGMNLSSIRREIARLAQ